MAWSSATIGGSLITDRVAPHRLAAISQQLKGLWPTGPYAIAAATAPVVEGLLSGTRAHVPAVVIVDQEFGVRNRAALLPVTLSNGRVLARRRPANLILGEDANSISIAVTPSDLGAGKVALHVAVETRMAGRIENSQFDLLSGAGMSSATVSSGTPREHSCSGPTASRSL